MIISETLTHTYTLTHMHTHTHTPKTCAHVCTQHTDTHAIRHTYVYMSSIVIQMNGICVCSLKERKTERNTDKQKHREWKKQKGRETEQKM